MSLKDKKPFPTTLEALDFFFQENDENVLELILAMVAQLCEYA